MPIGRRIEVEKGTGRLFPRLESCTLFVDLCINLLIIPSIIIFRLVQRPYENIFLDLTRIGYLWEGVFVDREERACPFDASWIPTWRPRSTSVKLRITSIFNSKFFPPLHTTSHNLSTVQYRDYPSCSAICNQQQ